jgi:hypothetical protein
VVFPISSGITADQLVVPDATPDLPLEVLQPTDTTPTLSDALPETVMLDEYTETMVEPGDTMVSEGGVMSPPPVGVEGG